MHTLTLSGLQYHARHGVYETEQIEGNDFEVDLIFEADLGAAGLNDDLSETIDYEKAEQIVRNVMERPPVQLLETLIRQIGETLFSHFKQAKKLEVRLRKLNPPLATPAKYSQLKYTWTR